MVIVGVMLSAFVITGMNDMLAINRNDSETVKVEIPENPTIDGIAQILAEDNVIDEPFYFKWFTKITESEGEFTQGIYEMRKNMDYKAITNYLLSTNNRTDTVKVVIPEGQNVLEIAQILKDNGVLSSTDKFVELCNSDEFDDDFDFIESITNADDRYYKLEGYLYPDTYEFYKNEEPKSCIYKFLNNFETKITEKQSVSGYKNLTTVQKMIDDGMTEYSLDEVMIVASIIQAEAADVNDMYIISSILHNRLNADSSMGVSKLDLILQSTILTELRKMFPTVWATIPAITIHIIIRACRQDLYATPVWTLYWPQSTRAVRITTSSVTTKTAMPTTHPQSMNTMQIWRNT